MIKEILCWIGALTCIYFGVEFLKFLSRQIGVDKKWRMFYHNANTKKNNKFQK